MAEPKNEMLGTMEPSLMHLSINLNINPLENGEKFIMANIYSNKPKINITIIAFEH